MFRHLLNHEKAFALTFLSLSALLPTFILSVLFHRYLDGLWSGFAGQAWIDDLGTAAFFFLAAIFLTLWVAFSGLPKLAWSVLTPQMTNADLGIILDRIEEFIRFEIQVQGIDDPTLYVEIILTRLPNIRSIEPVLDIQITTARTPETYPPEIFLGARELYRDLAAGRSVAWTAFWQPGYWNLGGPDFPRKPLYCGTVSPGKVLSSHEMIDLHDRYGKYLALNQ